MAKQHFFFFGADGNDPLTAEADAVAAFGFCAVKLSVGAVSP